MSSEQIVSETPPSKSETTERKKREWKKPRKDSQDKPKPKSNGNDNRQQRSTKLRGLPKDSPEVRLSKTVTWLLRHGAMSEGLPMRPDGYVKVSDLLENPKVESTELNLEGIKKIVEADSKKRFDLRHESETGEWWIKAVQGHTLKTVKLDLKAILSVEDIPSGVAVHGTTNEAWQFIATQGLSKMARNHIHLAQGMLGANIKSGMRSTSTILIFIDIPKALSAGIQFFLSDNGVILSEGDSEGFIKPEFFLRVERTTKDGSTAPVCGWEGPRRETADSEVSEEMVKGGEDTTPIAQKLKGVQLT